MTDRKDAAEWVNSEAAKQRKPPKNGGVFAGNGNVDGVFPDETVLVSGTRELVVSASSKYSVYSAMYAGTTARKTKAKSRAAQPGIAATIFDEVNGAITIYRDGTMKRHPPLSSPGHAPRMSPGIS